MAAVALLSCPGLGAALERPAYQLTKSLALGAPDRWDYVVFDKDSHRAYVAHGDRLDVVDGQSGALIGEVMGVAGGTHGVGVSASSGQGFTDDGRAGVAVAFDLKTFKITARIAADADADAIVTERATGRIFVIEGDPKSITVIDPSTNIAIATIKTGEKLEYAAADDQGVVYVAGNEKRDVLKIDARTNLVTAQWPAPDCASPHGLAFDAVKQLLFMGCLNSKLMVMDAKSGKVITELAIGRGSDAVVFDPVRRRIFSSNGVDGTITVYQQTASDTYAAMAPIATAVSGRTMAVDPQTGRLFVAAADTDPSPTPGGRAHVRPGTLRLMMFDPVN
jgi:DNA-binding beta-propeller fold protein YncE